MKTTLALVAMLAAARLPAAPASERYVDEATNATLAAANAYTDAHSGGGTVAPNYLAVSNAAMSAAAATNDMARAAETTAALAAKRDLTNNVCAATSATYGAWSRDNLPSGVTWDSQPHVADDGLWTWHYVDGSLEGYSQGGMGENDNDTFQTFGYGEGFTSTRTATEIALSNDTYTTYAFVTNAIATATPTVDFSTNNAALVYTVTNSAAAKSIEGTVAEWESYWHGDRVRISVTNYYGNTSGETPSFMIEESQTNEYGSVTNWVRVWDERTKFTNHVNQVTNMISGVSNSVMTAAWRQTNVQLANKAPRAWQSVTSAGEDAPDNTVWHTAPKTVFAGGTEYAHVAVGEGSICVLVDKGAPVFTEGAEGQFRFTDESGDNYFGFDVRQAYTIGCNTDGISVTTEEGEYLVSLTYDLTSSSAPTILHCTNLVENAWDEEDVTWEQNPPAGMQICYINAGSVPQGYYKAQLEYAGGAKFVTNMQADLAGGIAASNEVSNVIQSIVPVITSTGVVWKVIR